MRLTPHFTLEELTASETATRMGLHNTPSSLEMPQLTRLAVSLEQIRALLGDLPIHVLSGYRSPEVNALVGGASSSPHMDGRAADFICPGYGTPYEICKRLSGVGIEFDQLIFEGTWVHWAIPRDVARPLRWVFKAHFGPRGVRYTTGLDD